jgi:Icc-related predicted phosphoesterase
MRICAIGDPHGSLDKVKEVPLLGIDLILLTGDLGSANLLRKMAFDNIERKKQGLEEIEYTPAQKKRAFMEAYTSTIKVVNYLHRFAHVFTIFGNVEYLNYQREWKINLPLLSNTLKTIPGIRIINNRIVNFYGIRIGGLAYFVDTNWVQEFKPSDYKEKLAKAKKKKLTKQNKFCDGLILLIF